jgi:hypothetical protein
MLCIEIVAVCSQIHTKHINTLCGQNVPRSKHTPSVIKTIQLMLCSEIIADCSQIYRKHIHNVGRTYRAVNTLHPCYINHSVNAVYWSNRCLFSDHTKHKYTVWGRTYRAVNPLRLGYKNQSVNAVQWNNRCLFSDPHKHINTLWGRTYRVVNTLCLDYKNQSVNAV